MNRSQDTGDNEVERLIDGLADAVISNAWQSEADKVQFILSWVELSRISDERGETLFLAVCQALSHSFMACANFFVEDLENTWEDQFVSTENVCALLQPDLTRLDVCEYVSRMARDHVLNLNSDESTNLYFNGWDHLVWENEDQSNHPDSEAADAVVAAYAAMFVSIISSLPRSSRHDVRELLHDVNRELHTTVPVVDDRDNINDVADHSESQKLQRNVNRKASKPKRTATPGPASRVTQNSTLVPTDPRYRTYQKILKNRDLAISENHKIQSKPYYSNDGANYLAEAVARTLHCAPIPADISISEWFRQSPEEVVIVDARKIVLKVSDRLINAPQSAIKGRLLNMYNYFTDVEYVNVHRLQKDGLVSFAGEEVDWRYAVVLYRTDEAHPRYRSHAERNRRQ